MSYSIGSSRVVAHHGRGWRVIMRRSGWLMLASLSFLLLAACGASSSTSSSGSGDWFYHWNCNGDSECLATNPTGAASGTLDEGPVEAECTQILQFGQS